MISENSFEFHSKDELSIALAFIPLPARLPLLIAINNRMNDKLVNSTYSTGTKNKPYPKVLVAKLAEKCHKFSQPSLFTNV